jgi:ribonuclease D
MALIVRSRWKAAKSFCFAKHSDKHLKKSQPGTTQPFARHKMMKSATDETILIDQNQSLKEVVRAVTRVDEVAIDTEADSMHAYPEKVCLLQIRCGNSSWLVDPLADIDCSPLLEALKNKPLIFHAADYDLRLLYKRYGFRPTRIFDTMWAARLVGRERFGLEFLVKHYFDIQLEKGPQTANWGIRPLTPAMAHYALNDVLHLKPLAELLRRELTELKRLSWVEEISERVIEQACLPEEDVTDTEWRIKGASKLSRQGLAFLRAIWNWRETEAIRANRPPFFILSHDLAATIAARAAADENWINLIPRRMAARRRRHLEKAMKEAAQIKPNDFPQRLQKPRFRASDREKNRTEAIKKVRDAAAEALKLDPSIIASKATMIRLGLDDSDAGCELMQWQRDLLKL